MVNRRHTTSYRPPPVLAPALQEELRGVLAEALARNEPWTGSDVAAWMSEKLGRPVSYHLGWSYLVRLRHSPKRRGRATPWPTPSSKPSSKKLGR